MPTACKGRPEWVTQAPAMLNQAAPVQNTWYTVLAATGRYTKLELIVFMLTVTNETLEMDITCDGLPALVHWNAIANQGRRMVYNMDLGISRRFATQLAGEWVKIMNVEGHDLRVRMRKTTANGAGNLRCKVIYSVM